MALLAKNPLQKHYIGLPCMLGEVVGRIVGEHESGSWGEINGEKVFSIPEFSTPHGTIMKAGRFYIDEITEEGMKRLLDYEAELKINGKEMYAGRLESNHPDEKQAKVIADTAILNPIKQELAKRNIKVDW